MFMGRLKKTVSDTFSSWAKRSGNCFINLIIPHVFGEYGRPNYNSCVSTFCHQLTREEKPEVNPDGRLELIHVQDLVEKMIELYRENFNGEFRILGHEITVPELADKLEAFVETYLRGFQLPDLTDGFERRLFNTFRSSINHDQRNQHVPLHSDNRGWLVETVKANSGGQCFVSSTQSGITRGNHFHRFKVERFFVLQGKARIKLRRLFTNEVITYDVEGGTPVYVDMPTLYTHSITNIGEEELITPVLVG